MGVKPMKRLLKSLRCISHIFEVDKEEEFQIGFPTDVKHVAHIGQDGPSANAPSWMNEFKHSPEDLSVETNAVIVISNQNHTTNLSMKDVLANVCGQLPPIHSSAGNDSTKKSRSQPPLSSSVDSPSRKEKDSSGGKPRTLRRRRNSGQGSGLISSSGVPLNEDSLAMIESADGRTRSSRRSRRSDPISEDIAEESPRKKDTSGDNYRSSRRGRKSGSDPISEDTAGECLSRKVKSGGSSRSSRGTKKSGASEESQRRRKGSSGEGSVRSKGGSSDEGSVRSKAKKDEELRLGSGLRNTNLEMCEEEKDIKEKEVCHF